ncbi:MAG: hypothetical protein RIC52_17200, partial [Amphiplicatus sp.]
MATEGGDFLVQAATYLGAAAIAVPVFNRFSGTCWGDTNESRNILTERLLPETKHFLPKRGGVY